MATRHWREAAQLPSRARRGGKHESDSHGFGDETSNVRLGEAYQRIVTVPRSETYSVGNMFRGAIGRTPLPLLNYHPEMSAALERLLAEDHFDLIQVESIHLMTISPCCGREQSSVDRMRLAQRRIGSDVQYADRERNVARRAYARRTARLMSEAEARALKEFDAHIAVSEVDAKRLQSINSDAKIFVIENGVDAAHYGNEQSATKNRIVFVGSMDYHANIEGATSFARSVWPTIQQQQPNLRLTIVGRNTAAEVTEISSIAGIEVTGSVADVRPYYREALAAVVPLNVGGGGR